MNVVAVLSSFMLIFYSSTLWAGPYNSIGIVGDSLTTGASTSPHLNASLGRLLSIAARGLSQPNHDQNPEYSYYPDPESFNLLSPEDLFPPLRIHYFIDESSSRSIKAGEVIGDHQLDIEEYSFGFLLGKKLGILNDNIVLVGKDGQKIDSAQRQLRYLNHWKKYERTSAWVPEFFNLRTHQIKTKINEEAPQELPELIVLSYTANDICPEETLRHKKNQLYNKYYNSLLETLTQATSTLSPSPEGTQILVTGSVNPTQVLTNPEFLASPVTFNQETKTCGEIRSMEDKGALSFLDTMCSSVLKTKLNDHPRIEKLQSLWEEVVTAQRDAVSALPARPGFRVHFIEQTSNLTFKKDDLAQDCFHLSLKGQSKIANTLFDALNTLENTP